jgi:hypothetical protein
VTKNVCQMYNRQTPIIPLAHSTRADGAGSCVPARRGGQLLYAMNSARAHPNPLAIQNTPHQISPHPFLPPIEKHAMWPVPKA